MKIREIGDVITGKTPMTSKPEYFDGDIMFITPSDIVNGYRIDASVRHISESGYKSIQTNTLSGISVLIGCIGSDMGNVALVQERCATNQQINAITNFCENVNPFYVYYLLRMKKKYFQKMAGVTTTPILPKTVLEDIDILLPAKSNQDRVASLLCSIDEKIVLNMKVCSQLEAMAKTLYDYWFVQFDFPDKNGRPYRTFGGEMVWNAQLKREIPKGWDVTAIGKIADNFDSQRVPLSQNQRANIQGTIPYYGATGIMDYINDYIFDGQYVLIAEDGSVMDDSGHPIVQMIWDKTWVNNHAHVLQGHDDYSNEILYFILKGIPVVKIMTGSIQKKINQNNLNNYIIPSIPQKILCQFHLLVKDVFEKMHQLELENKELTELRDWLLPMLMNGQASVE